MKPRPAGLSHVRGFTLVEALVATALMGDCGGPEAPARDKPETNADADAGRSGSVGP